MGSWTIKKIHDAVNKTRENGSIHFNFYNNTQSELGNLNDFLFKKREDLILNYTTENKDNFALLPSLKDIKKLRLRNYDALDPIKNMNHLVYLEIYNVNKKYLDIGFFEGLHNLRELRLTGKVRNIGMIKKCKNKDKFMRNKSTGDLVKISKFMSLVLRHSPETIRVNMDKNGWVSIQELIDNANKYKNLHLSVDIIKMVVETNDKQRYILSDDGKRIRANQGHSIAVDLELESKTPPDILYHGTATRFLDSIMKDGLKPMTRQYVHLSRTEQTATAVGKRHGEPVILYIDARKMHEDAYKFYLSENKVWLTDNVPVKYILVKGA
ncbi:MAG: RNA 2'-phosphotransferase [Spirochaetales bacterium]|jgi:putative RNA 2'-phosphotransferase|nr:RNA 2'-phosphotransferase [Spirochaetales bacterium]